MAYLRATEGLPTRVRRAIEIDMDRTGWHRLNARDLRVFVALTPDADLLSINLIGPAGLAALRRWQPFMGGEDEA